MTITNTYKSKIRIVTLKLGLTLITNSCSIAMQIKLPLSLIETVAKNNFINERVIVTCHFESIFEHFK